MIEYYLQLASEKGQNKFVPRRNERKREEEFRNKKREESKYREKGASRKMSLVNR